MIKKFLVLAAVVTALPAASAVAGCGCAQECRKPCHCESRCRLKPVCRPCRCEKKCCTCPQTCDEVKCTPACEACEYVNSYDHCDYRPAKCCGRHGCKCRCHPKKCKRCVKCCRKRQCCPPKYYPWEIRKTRHNRCNNFCGSQCNSCCN